ncbi:MAG: sensor histidine kinase [Minisyncoccota bacterium]
MTLVLLSSVLITFTAIAVSAYLVLEDRKAKRLLEKREKDVSRRMYELAILKELGDRIGYSLNVQEIIDVITNSLHQFIEYSAVSYMLLEPEKVIFKIHLESSVHRQFVNEIRDRMLSSLSALLDREFDKKNVEEILSGAIIIEELEEPVRSFFNIPLVIDEKVVGVLTVADTKEGLYKEEEMTILYKIIQQASKAVTSLQGVVKTEQAKVNAMVESMEDGVVMTDADYRIMVINPAAKRVIGQEKKEDITIFDFIDNLGGKMDIRGRLEESVKMKKTYASERFQIQEKFYQAFVFPVKTLSSLNEGEVLGGVVIFHEVTREVELEHVRDDFTSMIVHELRAPLSGIQKVSELLKTPGKKIPAATSKEYVDLIYQNSSSMLDLVNDILDAAKLQAGKFEISREPADIIEVMRDRVSFFALSATDKKIRLSVSAGAGLPKDIPFDLQRIKQVLNNLISNALKFTNEGGSISLTAFLHEPGALVNDEAKKAGLALPEPLSEAQFAALPASLVVAVADTGMGILPEDRSELFSKFKQLNTKSLVPNIKGTGLGLAIARGILEGHGGIIGIASKVDVGSTFYFALPIVAPEPHSL